MRDLIPGMQTRNVRRWQRFLNSHPDKQKPFLLEKLSLSGYFGKATIAATEAFQRITIEEMMQKTGIPDPEQFPIKVNGIVDAATRSIAYELGFRMEFEIGPEREANGQADLREFRPYFLVPLLGDDLPKHPTSTAPVEAAESSDKEETEIADGRSHFKDAYTRISNWIGETHTEANPKITDVFIFSHGWHRNFYGAVQAYDRMASLIVRLRHRGRLNLPKDYRPLFLMLHWNSDPGEDEWVDRSGRRTRTSFLENVAKTFEPEEARNLKPTQNPDGSAAANVPKSYVEFINDFEEMHNLFARTSAPDVAALRDTNLQKDALRLTGLLEYYRVKDAPGADSAEKAAVAWACYHEAAASQILLDQAPQRDRFVTLPDAVKSLLKFVIGSLGLLTVLGAVFSGRQQVIAWIGKSLQWIVEKIPFVKQVVNALQSLAQPVIDLLQNTMSLLYKEWWAFIYRLPFLPWAWKEDTAVWTGRIMLAILLAIPAWMVLAYTARQRQNDVNLRNASGSGMPLPLFVCWAYLQVICSVIPLAALFVTYFFGWAIAWITRLFVGFRLGPRYSSFVPGLFDERFGIRNKTIKKSYFLPYARDVFGALTLFPADLLLRAAARDSALARLAEGLRAQVAFFRMQRRGVKAGEDAAAFLAGLFVPDAKLPHLSALQDARIHLTGHSFGGLVVANAVRVLALDDSKGGLQEKFLQGDSKRRISSLILLQAAMSSSWFHCEEKTCRFIKSTLACIYSGYDTANGFLYPAANNGRMAAGYAGLHHVGGKTSRRWGTYFKAWLGRTWIGRQLDKEQEAIEEEGEEPEHRARFISLAEPPWLNDPQYVPEGEKIISWNRQCPRLLNLDGSRLIYNGPVASGGGHGDVFKEAVINLIWAAITQGSDSIAGSTQKAPPPTASPDDGSSSGDSRRAVLSAPLEKDDFTHAVTKVQDAPLAKSLGDTREQ